MMAMGNDYLAFAAACHERRRVSVRQLLGNTRSLGLPAFQRGAVWDGAQAVAFLSSLERSYFVGTLLLWSPPSHQAGTEPLVAGCVPRLLLLDGQQRVRALHTAFFPPGAADGKVARRRPELTCIGADGDGRYWHGRRWERDRSHAAIPLALFRREIAADAPPLRYEFGRARRSGEAKAGTEERSLDETAGSWGAIPDSVRDRVRRLLDAEIAVEIVDFPEQQAIDNYGRLNAGGRGLSPEEIEFSSIVNACPEVPTRMLAESLALWSVPAVDASESTSGLGADEDPENGDFLEERDSLLQRGQERQFGLRALTRAVGIACDLTLGESQETGRALDAARLESVGDAGGIVEHAGSAVRSLGSILLDLGCDDRSRIPQDRAAFGGALALLIRFPELRDPANREAMKAVVLGLYLGASSDAFRVARKSFSAGDAVGAVLRSQLTVLPLGSIVAEVLKHDRSFGGPVDILYWVLRKRLAVDVPFRTASGRDVGVPGPLCAASEATRQHIVPWSLATPRVPRTARHWINSIGNITWISGAANGLDGWGALPMVFGDAAGPHFGEGFDPVLASLREAGDSACVDSAADASGLIAMRASAIGEFLEDWWRGLAQRALEEGVARQGPAGAFPMRLTLRRQLFAWWSGMAGSERAGALANACDKVVQSTSWAPGTGNDGGWGGKDWRVRCTRTRRSWKGYPMVPPDARSLRLEVRWPGSEVQTAGSIEFGEAAVQFPPGPGDRPARTFVIESEGDCDRLLKELAEILLAWDLQP